MHDEQKKIIKRFMKHYLTGEISNSRDVLIIVKIIKSNVKAMWFMLALSFASFFDEQIYQGLKDIGSSVSLEYISLAIALLGLMLVLSHLAYFTVIRFSNLLIIWFLNFRFLAKKARCDRTRISPCLKLYSCYGFY